MRRVPQRLVERVGEAQRHQVLHRLLAEIVVDAEDLVLAEIVADQVVQRAAPKRGRGRSAFPRTMREFGVTSVCSLSLSEISPNKRRRHRQVEHPDDVAVADRLLELGEAVAALGVGRDVAHPAEEFRQLGLVDILRLHVLEDRLLGKGAELFVAQLAARRADDPGRLGKLVVALAVIERRQELALRKVAGAAENDEVERIDRDDLACHDMSALLPVRRPALYSNRFKFASAKVPHART